MSFTRLVDVNLKYLYAGKVWHKIGFISAISSSKRSIQSTPFHILKISEPNLWKEYDSRHKFSKKWSLILLNLTYKLTPSKNFE